MNQPIGKPSGSRKEFKSQLTAYSATAAAVLLTAPAAQATIENITAFSVNNGSTYTTTQLSFSLASGTKPVIAATAGHHLDFHLTLAGAAGGSSVFASIRGHVADTLNHHVSNLALGHALNAAAGGFTNGVLASRTTKGGGAGGNFLPLGANAAKTGYIGFKTKIHSHTYYGWLRVQVKNSNGGYPAQVNLLAKSDTDIFGALDLKSDLTGDHFDAGSVSATPTPEPSATALGGLGLLALGAAGVREMRRRRKAEKAL